MPHWAVIVLVVAIGACILAFRAIASTAVDIFQILSSSFSSSFH